jgi:hypothetical protein
MRKMALAVPICEGEYEKKGVVSDIAERIMLKCLLGAQGFM